MKKILLSTLLVALFAGTSNFTFGQRQQGEVDITVGVGYSLGMQLARGVINIGLTEANLNKATTTPIINGMVDYGVTDQFSLGGAYSFHQWSWEDKYFDTITGSVTSGSVKVARHNLGIRGLVHFGDNDRLDIYTGARIGASIWVGNFDASNTQGQSASEYTIPGAIFSAQALFGVRAYFNDFIGANFEFGLGTAPYMIGGGLTFRIR